MSNIVKEVRLIKADVNVNNNKFWNGTLLSNGDVVCVWGRVGNDGQSKTFHGAGESYLDRKTREKQRKEYKKLKVISEGSSVEVGNSDLKEIARKQIKTTGNKDLDHLIDRLIQANIHTITSSTNISYNKDSGLFSTPLGIVTRDAIDDARAILSTIQPLVESSNFSDSRWSNILNEYMTLIPQDVGRRRVTPERLFPDLKAVSAQSDILDSLEVSIQTLQSKPKVDSTNKEEKELEKIFDVSLDIVTDKEFKRIRDKYHATRKDAHVCSHLDVKKIFAVSIADMVAKFEKAKSIGNIHELWHGTSTANLLSILKSGLRKSPPGTARITGKMFGNGVYFAVDSSKSANYSYGYWSGTKNSNCFLFLADVIMGNPYIPKNGFDPNVEKKIKCGYDSCWAKAGKSGVRNDECIVYDDDRFNLTYLVELSE